MGEETLRKQKFLLLVMAVTMVCNLCGCETDRGAADGREAVSPSTGGVSGKSDRNEGKSEETGGSGAQPTNPFITKNCMYRKDHLEEHLIQTDLHGKKLNKFPIENWDETLRISDSHICYTKGETLYVSPIRQTKQGEEIIWEEKKKIAKEPDDVALVEPYLIYTADTVYRYDMNTGEKLPLGNSKEWSGYFHDNWWLLPAVYEGKLYLDDYTGQRDCIYQIDIGAWKARKVYTYTKEEEHGVPEVIAARGECICVNANTEARNQETRIFCYDMENDMKTMVTGAEISAVLEKEGLWEADCKKKDWCVDASFSYGGKVYLQIDMSWEKKGIMKKWGEKGKTEVERTLLLSCPWDDIRNVTYEKEISEWWYDRADRTTIWGEDECFEEYSMGDILTLYGENLYVKYSNETGYHVAAYHMGTGEYRELGKRETEYRLMDWSWDS